MAIRCISFSTYPLFKPSLQTIPTPICCLNINNHRRFVREDKMEKTHLLIGAKMSAERDLLTQEADTVSVADDVGILSIHHVGILCENLEKSLSFYRDLLGLKINEARPHDKLPFRGAWLWVGDEMIHLMELPNPDPLTGRPEHGGRDRHHCFAIQNVSKLKAKFDKADLLQSNGVPHRVVSRLNSFQDVYKTDDVECRMGIKYTLSRSGRPAIFARDPDGNALEFAQVD